MMDDNSLGSRLKELRAAKANRLGRRKIPQREVAGHLNISPGAYGSWESGRTRPDVTLLPKVADYFEVSVDFLLGNSGGGRPSLERTTTQTGLAWSVRRAAQTDNEQKGIQAWQRLAQGDSLEAVAEVLKSPVLLEVERYLLDVIYTDMISIDHLPCDGDLAQQVRQAFGLREVVVVATPPASPPFLKNILLGQAARSFFNAHVYEGMKVGIAGGYSVSCMIYSLRRGECQNIEVYPLAISPVVESIAVDTNSLVGAFSYRHHGYNVRGYCLQYASHEDMKKAKDLQKFALTRRILAKARTVDIAFIGLGTFKRRMVPIHWLGDLLESRGLSYEAISQRGAVGDILYHLVDHNGQPVASELDNLICSIELEGLREMVQWGVPVAAIAMDPHKAEIARAAIRGGYANVFIIDDELARAMLASEVQDGRPHLLKAVVSGATVSAMPRPMTATAGKKVVQNTPPTPGSASSAKPAATISGPTISGSRAP
jgi:DNA-binding transcriptional regulator LsrR (DeoR family)/DNA-binding XRE family transcriptional regulator